MIDPLREGEAPAEPVFTWARQEARPPDRNVAPEAAGYKRTCCPLFSEAGRAGKKQQQRSGLPPFGFHRVDLRADMIPVEEATTEEIVLGAMRVECFIESLGEQALKRLVRNAPRGVHHPGDRQPGRPECRDGEAKAQARAGIVERLGRSMLICGIITWLTLGNSGKRSVWSAPRIGICGM